jgi:imidazolonepropionase-like amidohydrolase
MILCLLLSSCTDTPTSPTVADFPDEPAPDPQPAVVAFVGVNVVPMDRDRVLRNQTVVVRGDRIESLGPADAVGVPDGAFRIEGQGRYLMPGLADMHVHLTSRTFEWLRNDFVLWIANGVTTVRVMWGSPGIVAERQRIDAGEVLGPRLLVASPGLDAPGGTWTASTPPVANPGEARARVLEHAATGYDFIKVYNDLDGATYDAIVDEAGRGSIPVVGHVPRLVGIERVQDAGQLTLEHMIGFKREAATPLIGGTIDLGRVRRLAERSRDAGVWHTPTIVVNALSVSRVRGIRSGQELRYVSPGMRQFFETGFWHGREDGVSAREEQNYEAMTRAVHDVGARLLVGTDAGFGWVLPGYSIHDELRHFVGAGLSPFQALVGATSAAAESVSRPNDFGRIAPGRPADLILLADNPLEDVGALRQPSGTMVRGRWLSRGTLAVMLEAIAVENGAARGGAAPTSRLGPHPRGPASPLAPGH